MLVCMCLLCHMCRPFEDVGVHGASYVTCAGHLRMLVCTCLLCHMCRPFEDVGVHVPLMSHVQAI